MSPRYYMSVFAAVTALTIAWVCLAVLFGNRIELNETPATQIENLIDQLASRNPPPKLAEFGPIRYGNDYDLDYQKEVEEAYIKLWLRGKSAFPVLIENLDDDRYSFTSSAAILFHVSVGEACRWLIESRVAFVDIYPPNSKSPLDYFQLKWDNDYRQWWLMNQHLTLRQMQINALEYLIKKARQYEANALEAQQALAKLKQQEVAWGADQKWFSRDGEGRVLDIFLYSQGRNGPTDADQ